eukprot:TRINITY_DN91375_c0_g2_i2.p1 TRINITY_DN91375_c0_g2~~TRINITY_DN91375_c0_g2_i2.p1  ORF type:complete len:125 (+),score=29.80 TRINITY_DN91375_c0_g2_i2:144-518(+)
MPFYRQPFTKGHLVIKFDVKFPAVLSPEQVEGLSKFLPESKPEDLATSASAAGMEDEDEEEEEIDAPAAEVKSEKKETVPPESVETKLTDFDPSEIQKMQQAQTTAYEEDESSGGPQVVQCASQ